MNQPIRPIEADYVSQVAYTRALESYCDAISKPLQKPIGYWLTGTQLVEFDHSSYHDCPEWEALYNAAPFQPAPTQPAQPVPVQPEQEPVTFYRCKGCGHAYEQSPPSRCDCMASVGFDRLEYYTTPPAAQPAMFGPMGTVGALFDKHVIGRLDKSWRVYVEKT